MMTTSKEAPAEYGLPKEPVEREMAAPELPYRPPKPRHYRPNIGLIGCGGITAEHLRAYKAQGYDVVALCDIDEAAARKRQGEFYPDAALYTDHQKCLEHPGVDVVDIATHPGVRAKMIEDALSAGKHVLSQKPFVLDLDVGEALVRQARAKGLKLAVNQNGRWAPYFAYLRETIKAGLLGDIVSVDMMLAWDHTWIRGTLFERLHHVVLYDFAIHWFDMICTIFAGRDAQSVFANSVYIPGQTLVPPMSAHAVVRFNDGLATAAFHGHTLTVNRELLTVTGTQGVYSACGKITSANEVTLVTADGRCKPELTGEWFPDGFAGAMGELLCAIEDQREAENSAENNLRSLALTFAVLESARTGQAVRPGAARAAGAGCTPL